MNHIHEAAERGRSGGGSPLPYRELIQKGFGRHDISHVTSYSGPEASEAAQAIGAEAYASGEDVVFGGGPDLHTAAHEAAHIVQQRGGVALSGGVGQAGDRYEQHADEVADAVVKGESAEALLDAMTGDAGVQRTSVQHKAVQRKPDPKGEGDNARDVLATSNMYDALATSNMYIKVGDTSAVDTSTDDALASERCSDEAITNKTSNEEAYFLVGSETSAIELERYVNDMTVAINNWAKHHVAGIQNFINTMQFKGSQAAQADTLGAIFSGACKFLLNMTLNRIAGVVPNPLFSAIVGVLRSVIESAADEVGRAGRAAAEANGEANLAAWSRDLNSNSTTFYSSGVERFRASTRVVLAALFAKQGGFETALRGGGMAISGDKARMLNGLKTHLNAFQDARPSPQAFQDAVTVQWVMAGGAGAAGMASDRGLHGLGNGRIRAWVDSDEDDGQWTFEVEGVRLYAVSHQAQAADLIRDALRSGRKTLWNCGIPVEVMMRGPTPNGGSTWHRCPVSGPRQGEGPSKARPEAHRVWHQLLLDKSVWTDMESVACSKLEGNT